MQIKWYSHLKNKQEQDEFKKYIINSGKVLDRIHDLCYNMIKDSENVSSTDYDSPSWAFKQADRNGYLRAYQEMIDLVKINKDH